MRRRAASSNLPLVKGVTNATYEPLNIDVSPRAIFY
jgi:hypothetical protein